MGTTLTTAEGSYSHNDEEAFCQTQSLQQLVFDLRHSILEHRRVGGLTQHCQIALLWKICHHFIEYLHEACIQLLENSSASNCFISSGPHQLAWFSPNIRSRKCSCLYWHVYLTSWLTPELTWYILRKTSSDTLPVIISTSISDVGPCIFGYVFWHSGWHIFWQRLDMYLAYSDMLNILSDFLERHSTWHLAILTYCHLRFHSI